MRKVFFFISVLLLAACGAEKDMYVYEIPSSPSCGAGIAPYFEPYLDEVSKRIEKSDLPAEDLARITSMQFVSEGDLRLGDKTTLGTNDSVYCDGRTSFVIRVVDPDTLTGKREGKYPLGSASLSHVIYHEIMHIWFRHYDGRDDLSATDGYGLMAALVGYEKDLTEEEVLEGRLEDTIRDEDYRAHVARWR